MMKTFLQKIKCLSSGIKKVPPPGTLCRILKEKLPSWTLLVVVCMICGLVLGGVHELLKDRIAAHTLLAPELLARAFPAADSFERVSNPSGYDVGSCYAAYSNDELVGFVISVSERGRNGMIQVQVGVDLSGRVVGTYIDSSKHQETRDIGGDAIESEEFQSQFLGGSDPFVIGENVDAVTFATVSSSAVIHAVNRALEAAQQLISEGA